MIRALCFHRHDVALPQPITKFSKHAIVMKQIKISGNQVWLYFWDILLCVNHWSNWFMSNNKMIWNWSASRLFFSFFFLINPNSHKGFFLSRLSPLKGRGPKWGFLPGYEPNLGMKFLHNSKLIRFFEKLLAQVTINCHQKLPRIASYKMHCAQNHPKQCSNMGLILHNLPRNLTITILRHCKLGSLNLYIPFCLKKHGTYSRSYIHWMFSSSLILLSTIIPVKYPPANFGFMSLP